MTQRKAMIVFIRWIPDPESTAAEICHGFASRVLFACPRCIRLHLSACPKPLTINLNAVVFGFSVVGSQAIRIPPSPPVF